MINLLFSADENYIQHLTVVLHSIYDNNKENRFRIFFFVSGNTLLHKKLLLTIKELGFEYEIISVDPSDFNIFHTSHHATLANYYRLHLAKLLPADVQKVIYLDSDIIVKGNLKELWETDIAKYAIGAVEEKNIHRHAELGIPPQYTYFNSGVMLINVNYFRETGFFEKAKSYYTQNRDNILWWDQDIMNALLYDKTYLLPFKWNLKTDDFQTGSPEITREVCIIHFTGSFKPWHYKNAHPRKDDYFYYLRKTRFKGYNPLIQHIKTRISNKIRRVFNVK